MLTESQITMLKKKDETKIFDNVLLNAFIVFWIYIIKKIIFSLVSVKVWALIGITWVSTYLVIGGYITGANFAAIICTLVTTILAAREVAKIGYTTAEKTVAATNPTAGTIIDTIKDKILNENTDEVPD